MKSPLILWGTLIFLSSCIQEVNFDVPDDIIKAGVNCILVSDEEPRVTVYQTCSMHDSLEVKYITYAEVRLVRSDGFDYQFELSDDSTFYYSDDLAQQGHSYYLEVLVEDHVLTASTGIPGTADILKTEFNLGKYQDEYGEDLTHCEIEFEDVPGEDNYYQMFLLDTDHGPVDVINFWSFNHISDPLLVEESLLEYEPSCFIFSDKNSIDSKISIELLGFWGSNTGRPSETDLVVRTVSAELYEFLKSWIIHYYNQNNPNHIDVLEDLDPYRIFLQEQPVPLYSNIEGGVGIFGAYSESRKSFNYVE
jgi:hypothetical protein